MSVRFVRSLEKAARSEAEKHTHSMWSEGRSLDAHVAYQEEQLARATPELLSYAGLVDDSGEVIASLKRFFLSMSSGGVRHPVLGIGAVMVPEDRRKKGLGKALIEAVLNDARNGGADLALLFSEIDPTYYRRLGFVPVEWPIFACATSELPFGSTLLMRAPSEEAVVTAAIANELDEKRFGESSVLRPKHSASTRAYFAWRNHIETIWLERPSGARVGYVSIASADPATHAATAARETLEITDWAFDGVAKEERFAALKAVALSRGASFIAGTLGADAVDARFASFASDAHGVPMLLSLEPTLAFPIAEDGRVPAGSAHFGLSDYF